MRAFSSSRASSALPRAALRPPHRATEPGRKRSAWTTTTTPRLERAAPGVLGGATAALPPATTSPARSSTACPCSPTPAASCTWGTCATTRSPTPSPATSACRAKTCCTRWAGTPSACRRRTPPSPTRRPPAKWTYSNIEHMRASSRPWASASTGSASSPPAARVLPLGAVVLHPPVREGAGVQEDGHGQLGSRWIRPCWPTSRSSTAAAGAPARSVERREIPQWFLRITAYAEELLEDSTARRLARAVRTMQRNWIGKSRGVELASASTRPWPARSASRSTPRARTRSSA
jgi:hypothetical protein